MGLFIACIVTLSSVLRLRTSVKSNSLFMISFYPVHLAIFVISVFLPLYAFTNEWWRHLNMSNCNFCLWEDSASTILEHRTISSLKIRYCFWTHYLTFVLLICCDYDNESDALMIIMISLYDYNDLSNCRMISCPFLILYQ